MRRTITSIISILLLMTLIGCNDSEVMEQGTSAIEERVPVTIHTAIPLADLPSSRAITDDSAIHDYEIWVFSDGQLYERKTNEKVVISDDGTFTLLLPMGLSDVTLAMVANVNNLDKLTPSLDATKLDLSSYTDYMPMFGTTGDTTFDITPNLSTQTIVLFRMLAKVEVRAKEAVDHFTLSEVFVYQYAKDGRTKKISEDDNLDTENNSGHIYLPAITPLNDNETKTCVIIKGTYNGKEGFCKLDFIQRIESDNGITYSNLEAIENNHQYIFDVQYLTDGTVYESLEDALKNEASNYVTGESTKLITINNEHIMDITTNNYIYLGVTAGNISTTEGGSYHVANVSIVTNSDKGWKFESLPEGVSVSISEYLGSGTAEVISVWVYLDRTKYRSGSSVTIYVYGNNIRKSITITVP